MNPWLLSPVATDHLICLPRIEARAAKGITMSDEETTEVKTEETPKEESAE